MSAEGEDAPSFTRMPTLDHPCPACQQTNHAGSQRCVSCGAPLASAVAFLAPSHATADTLLVSSTRGQEPPGRPHSEPDPPSEQTLLQPHIEEIAAVAAADPLLGAIVAERYRILELLGRGGMGIVYKVEHIRIGKLMAMKLLTGELSRNREVVRRFKQEALTASKLGSPNTVQVFDFGVSEGLTYLVMELIAGEDLARVLRTQGPMPFPRLAKVVIQACTSLSEAHHKGIIHRDVKPENIMLMRSQDGTEVAKVLDFGLAKLREGAELNDLTSQGAVVGTPYFMAPEQIRGEAVDARTDVYALGALMYRALTGHYPFNGPTPMSVFTKHVTESPMPLAERAPGLFIPSGASAIVLKALRKNAADRYQRVEDLQAALVAEIRNAGTSNMENLLDSGQVRQRTRVAPRHDTETPKTKAQIATRDEVERYERELRRKRWGAYLILTVMVMGGGTGASVGLYRWLAHERAAATRGLEIEPNNTLHEATFLPFGTSLTGILGKRLDATHGDRDFYVVDIPAAAPGALTQVKIRVTSLPNFGMCTMMYRKGFTTPMGQYCVGRPSRDLFIPTMQIEPGRYFFAILQDLDPYGGPAPFIHENISDSYSIAVEPAARRSDTEVEPNDRIASANLIARGGTMTGTLAWSRDEDVFCVAGEASGTIRWKVRDELRDAGAVLEVTPLRGPQEGAAVRIHAGLGKGTSTDALSPWTSTRVATEGTEPRCLRLRLSNDPWSGAAAAAVPAGGSEAYVVEVEGD